MNQEMTPLPDKIRYENAPSKALNYVFKYLGDLPPDYSYKMIKQDGMIKIIGVHKDKSPIGFILTGDKLEKINLDI